MHRSDWTSNVYSSVVATVMASLRSVRTSLVFFDTSGVDTTKKLADPVDVLFGSPASYRLYN